jgi:8-oxo-dGTP diphosphatase
VISETPPSKQLLRVVAAVIESEGRYLITQRRGVAVLPLLWEFPGGRVEAGETDQLALQREVEHRIGVNVRVGKLISFVRHEYERYTVDLHLYDCAVESGTPQCRNVNDFRWVGSSEFDAYPFTPADEASVALLLGIQ